MFNAQNMHVVRDRLLNRLRNRHCDIVITTSVNNEKEVVMWCPKGFYIKVGDIVLSNYNGKAFVSEVTQIYPASDMSEDLTPFNMVRGVVDTVPFAGYDNLYSEMNAKLNAIILEEQSKYEVAEEGELFSSLGDELKFFYEEPNK